ncbi:GrpB family protein [Paenibacillus kobensis]|uniref:GrpB family protein n=1 Tax=Paenibacillus kobensis TaxID=59841 RepID=UPI0015809F0E|nr:GrpB family protein [Paenibacillus kobensis]
MEKPVVIECFNEDWAGEYKREEGLIKGVLAETAIAIEHIGSTSVPGLGAKPIIDTMAGVRHLDAADRFIEPLSQLGYEHVYHADFPNRRFFRKGQWRAGTHHLHIYTYGSEEWNNQLLFRDYLIAHPDVREQYNQLKLALADAHRNDRTSYTNAKHPFITDVIRRAQAEKAPAKGG